MPHLLRVFETIAKLLEALKKVARAHKKYCCRIIIKKLRKLLILLGKLFLMIKL